jgi:predicted aspartyl protease
MNDKGSRTMGRITVDMEVANHLDVSKAAEGALPPDKVRRVRIKGLVDTGAVRLILPPEVVKQLGLPAAGDSAVRYADHRTATLQRVSDAEVTLVGRTSSFTALVEPQRTDALIGAIVLEELDLLVDCAKQELVRRDPNTIVSEIE